MARRKPAHRPVSFIALPVIASLLLSGCVFGGSDDNPEPTQAPEQISRPATSRTGVEPTPTPFGGALRVEDPTPTAADPDPARSPVDGLISVEYTHPFIWPVDGPISSFMDPEHPNGIDIAFDDAEVMPAIRASAGGTVLSAGGSEDEDLGIAVVLDHGNGITTTYGHLSEVLVTEGDSVSIGDDIGVGGSTGISTGAHLHLEVRLHGETVDPLQVLPNEGSDSVQLTLDCETTPLTLPAGSQALFDLQGVLEEGEQLMAVIPVSLNGGPELSQDILGADQLRVGSPINFEGPEALNSYDLELTIDNPEENRVLNCPLVVQQREVPTTFYVRALPPASEVPEGEDGEDGEDSEGGEDSGEATAPEPTPEPTPSGWPGTPNYQAPGSSPGGAQAPSYSAPGAGSGGDTGEDPEGEGEAEEPEEEFDR